MFNLQGVGQWAVSSVFQGDLPVVLAVTVVVAIAVTLMNLIVDIVYAYLDPGCATPSPAGRPGVLGLLGELHLLLGPWPGQALARLQGKWQAARSPLALGSSGGSSWTQRSWALGQRGWNRQPDGGSIGEGTSPSRITRSRCSAASGSGTGIADSSAPV